MAMFAHSFDERLQAFYFVLFFVMIAFIIARRRGFFISPLPVRSTHVHFFQVVGAFFIFFVLMLVVIPFLTIIFLSLWAGHLVDPKSMPLEGPTEGWFNVISIITSFLGVIIYTFLLPNSVRTSIWGGIKNYSDLGRNMMMGMISWFLAFPLVALVSQVAGLILIGFGLPSGQHEQVAVRFLRMSSGYPYLFLVVALLIMSIVPIVEELLFRGFLQTWLRKRFGVFIAIIVASLIFTFFHYSSTQGWDNIELLASLFTLSCFLGYIYERQQSLWSSIMLHATFNGISVLAIILSNQ